MISRRRLLVTAAAAGIAAGGTEAAQANWPLRPVRLIVPLAAGGAIDFVARQCSQVLSREMSQQVYVENRTGAGGTIGMDAALRSPPDGYTFLLTNDNAAIATHILNLPYDYTKELVPVITITRQPIAVAVHPSLGVSSIADYVAYAKEHPGLGFASSGVGSNQHVIGAWLAKQAGIKLDHVPYRGAGQAVSDLIAGHVKSGILGPAALIQHDRSGSIKIIAQSGKKRSGALPDVPTLIESGFDGMALESWAALFAPPNTDGGIIRSLNIATENALQDSALREHFANACMEPVGGTPDSLRKLAIEDSDKYARLIKELHISAVE